MAIHLDQVLDYLDAQCICRKAKDVGSLMETLQETYAHHSGTDAAAIRENFRQLRRVLTQLPEEYRDLFFDRVCALCTQYEQLAFSQGVVVGMLLMTEVNRVR
ncbi:MAG: hypothetical protein IJB59_08260 [Oscillospiraceae bacterium]|nr:hypothetical protein [Oscillospiraceae bacterium]